MYQCLVMLRSFTAIFAVVLFVSPAVSGAAGCPSVNRNWSNAGPFNVDTSSSGVGHTIYYPANVQGCTRHPVILWGNGTGATPISYDGLLRHWASHGFIVVAANTMNAGSGSQMLAGLDYITRENSRVTSLFYQRVDLANVGASGHSQGGGGAIRAGEDRRVKVTAPIQPGPQGNERNLKGPVFFLAGEWDTIVSATLLVLPRYKNATQVVAVYGELNNADHFEPVGNGGGFRGPVTAWTRFWLMGDEEARGEFFGSSCRYCSQVGTLKLWSDFRRNTKALAVPAAN